MNKFRVSPTERAVEDLRDISRDFRDQVHRDLKTLASAPFPSGTFTKRLKGFRPPVYRLRSGDFRVLYHVEGENVTILRIIDRKVLERTIAGTCNFFQNLPSPPLCQRGVFPEVRPNLYFIGRKAIE